MVTVLAAHKYLYVVAVEFALQNIPFVEFPAALPPDGPEAGNVCGDSDAVSDENEYIVIDVFEGPAGKYPLPAAGGGV